MTQATIRRLLIIGLLLLSGGLACLTPRAADAAP